MKTFKKLIAETFNTPDNSNNLCNEELVVEAKGYELYHKDFSTAMQHAYAYAKSDLGITVDPSEIDDKVAMGPRKPSNGKTNSYRLLGTDGKKAIQVQVYNMGNSFELNMYKESVDLQEAMSTPLAQLTRMVPSFSNKMTKDERNEPRLVLTGGGKGVMVTPEQAQKLVGLYNDQTPAKKKEMEKEFSAPKGIEGLLKSHMNEAFTDSDAPAMVKALKDGIEAPFVSVSSSSLGGPNRPSIGIKVALEPQSEWKNKIYQNASHGTFMMHMTPDGNSLELVTSGGKKTKFRKAKFKDVKDVVMKINKWVEESMKMNEDVDLDEAAKKGLWYNIQQKRKRIKAGSDEKMRKPGSDGAPTDQDFKDANESVMLDEMFSDVHPTLKKELGIHGADAIGMAETDKGVAVSFNRAKNISDLKKQMGQHGYSAVTQSNSTTGHKNVYHFS
tara:strand:- start:90 stop:1418 length:1329 start_codon:yes stop_codon:yes gene_type:complete